MSNVIVIVALLGILAMIGSRVFRVLIAVANHYAGDFINRHLLFKKLQPPYQEVLSRRSAFYQKLPGPEKRYFERRVQKFINLKEFIPRGGLKEVTPEMKAMVAATAMQITHGFPRVYFRHFKRILLYPDNYYSRINQRYHQGEVHTKGYILLAWRSFEEGFSNPADGINLGLHEMAHALKIENLIANNDYLYLDPQLMDRIRKEAAAHIHKIRSGEEVFFRKDAGANFHEFFAVAVENFFERPSPFKQQHPRLFLLLGDLLKQSPPL